MIHTLSAATIVVLVTVVSGQSFCGETPVVWRNNNVTCPARAVCTDVFTGRRNWHNGTSCDSVRTLHNCLCPNDGGEPTVCPYNNDAHRIYASKKHQRFTCQPVCNLPYCNNISRRPQNNPNDRVDQNVAIEALHDSDDMNGRSYYRLSCRCPRHNRPHKYRRSVRTYRHTWWRPYKTMYTCDQTPAERRMEDWC